MKRLHIILLIVFINTLAFGQREVRHGKSVVRHGSIISHYTHALPPPEPWEGEVYYVAADGDDGRTAEDAKSISTPWATISHAMSVSSGVAAGDSIYVKAGNYASEYVTFSISGTAEKRIVIQGYKATPGDQPKTDWARSNYPAAPTYDAHDINEMPYFQGVARNYGTGFNFNKQEYITVNNMQTLYYEIAVWIDGGNNIIENFYCTESGDWDGYQMYMSSGIYLAGNKDPVLGDDLGYDADSCKVIDCEIVNGPGSGIWTYSEYDSIIGCEVYADDNRTGTISAMDYYIVITGAYNHIQDCHVERVGNLAHGGHGIGVKGFYQNEAGNILVTGAAFNSISGCTVVNMEGESLWTRKTDAGNTVVENCEVNGGLQSLVVGDGSSNNRFSNIWVHDLDVGSTGGAILFWDGSENGQQPPCDDNVFENITISNVDIAINLVTLSGGYATEVRRADFYNLTIYNANYLMRMSLPNSNMEFTNGIVEDVTARYYQLSYTDNFTYSYNDWYNVFESPPVGVGGITTDPSMTNPGGDDFTLQSGSLCIDAGIDVGLPFLGTAPDMGAHEKE